MKSENMFVKVIKVNLIFKTIITLWFKIHEVIYISEWWNIDPPDKNIPLS